MSSPEDTSLQDYLEAEERARTQHARDILLRFFGSAVKPLDQIDMSGKESLATDQTVIDTNE